MSIEGATMPVMHSLSSSAYTIFLFTKSDTLFVIVSVLAMAMVLAGPTDWLSFLMAFVWLELHLLAFNIKNQMIGVEEDRLCKPDRPFPSGRFSLEQGQILYSSVIALAIASSIFNGLTRVSLIYMFAIWLYNENGLSVHPLLKSPLAAVAYMCCCWGTTYIVGHRQSMTDTSVNATVLTGLLYTMTGHAQDFRDRSGDALLGRRTIPIILPQGVARWSLLLMIASFTSGLIWRWHPPMFASLIFAILGMISSLKFIINHSEVEDRKSFRWYELWWLCVHILPIFERISRGEISAPYGSS